MGIQIVSFERTTTRRKFTEAVTALGQGKARTAAARALNHEGRKGLTATRREMVRQTSIKRSVVVANTKLHRANKSNLQIEIEGRGGELNLKDFGARQFSYGIRAKVWGRFQQFKSAFIIGSYSGKVFKRRSSKRFPLDQVFGPSIAKELLRDDVRRTFFSMTFKVQARFEHELNRIKPA